MKKAVHAREGTPRAVPPEDDGAEAVKEKEEEKGRIILVNALPALTSATSRCTRPTRDQIPSKLRERTDASRRVQRCTAPFRMTTVHCRCNWNLFSFLRCVLIARGSNIVAIYVGSRIFSSFRWASN